MSTIDCSACDTLRETAPSFVQNGVTTAICNSLKNNTGLNPGNKNKNGTDLNNANDCLVGRMDQELEMYENCEWKDFMHKFLPNLYELEKALICSDTGQWNNIEEMWCWLRNLATTPKSYSLHAYPDDDPSKEPINGFRIAEGVSMRTGANASPLRLRILGHHLFISGSLSFYGNMPSDYTNGQEVPWSYLQHGCASLTNIAGDAWGKDGSTNAAPLVYEYQIRACDYGFSNIFGGFNLGPVRGGDFLMRLNCYRAGQLVPPDYSTVEVADGEYKPGAYIYEPDDDQMMLLQVRLSQTRLPLGNITPNGVGVVIACPDSWSC